MHRQAVLGTGLALLLIASLPSSLQGQSEPGFGGFTTKDFTISAKDGTSLAATVYIPNATGPHPAILMTHGWPGNRHVDYVAKRAERFASQGYLVVAYDSRGYGDSGGETTLDGPNEIADARLFIDWIAQRPDAVLDGPGDPRLGMIGRSYAGGLAQLTAMNDPRVDALVPENTWNNLLQALFPNKVLKQVWVTLLFASGEAETHGVPLGNTNPSAYHPDGTGGASPQLAQWYAQAMATNAANDEIAQEVGVVRSIDAGRLRAPSLFVQGWNDTLFDPSHAVKSFTLLRANGTPGKLVLFAGGHGISLPWNSTQSQEIERRIDAWFAYYLQRDPAAVWVTDWPVETWESWSGRFVGETSWPSYRTVPQLYYLDGSQGASISGGAGLAASPGADATVWMAQGPAPANYVEFPNFQSQAPRQEATSPATSVLFVSNPLASDTRLMGTPFVDVALTQQAPGGEVIVMLRLTDVAPDGTSTTLLKQVTPVRAALPLTAGASAHATLPLTPITALVPKGHRLGFGVTTSDPAFGASRVANVVGVATGASARSLIVVPTLDASLPSDPWPPFLDIEAADAQAPIDDVPILVHTSDNLAVTHVSIEVSFDGAVVASGAADRPGPEPLRIDLPSPEPGLYTIRASATDAAALVTNLTKTILVSPPAPEAPASPAGQKGVPGFEALIGCAALLAVVATRRRR